MSSKLILFLAATCISISANNAEDLIRSLFNLTAHEPLRYKGPSHEAHHAGACGAGTADEAERAPIVFARISDHASRYENFIACDESLIDTLSDEEIKEFLLHANDATPTQRLFVIIECYGKYFHELVGSILAKEFLANLKEKNTELILINNTDDKMPETAERLGTFSVFCRSTHGSPDTKFSELFGRFKASRNLDDFCGESDAIGRYVETECSIELLTSKIQGHKVNMTVSQNLMSETSISDDEFKRYSQGLREETENLIKAQNQLRKLTQRMSALRRR
ncbi:hypothetical protein FJ366_02190 [Candidatus Dependentiae bacterium]|nr:hypothetical protein [Candidatus Dependentiae bacterium]